MTAIFLTHSPTALAGYYRDKALAGLQALGDVRRNRVARDDLSAAELIEAARGCAVIVSYRQTPGYGEIFAALPDLVAFVRCAVDIRNVDVAAASRAGVLVTRASPGFVPAVAEHIIGLMVDLARGITDAATSYRKGQVPTARMGRQLRGATLGIIGYGAIGRYLAELGLAFGMRVLVSDPYVTVEREGLRQTDMSTLLAESDFVVPLAVATEETENLIDAHALARMKRSAFLVNASRGNLVDETALERALDEGRIAGAAMDVGRAPDQMPSPALAARADVIATPHTAGLTPEAIEHQALETVRQVASILRGEAPPGAVNAEAAHRLRDAFPRKE
jgi:D-3-phosphoglycerate dehydrogenase / 2-oxoglutarate reductase